MGKNRVNPVTIRLTPEERDWLYQHIEELDIPLNGFFKKLLKDYRYENGLPPLKGDKDNG